MAKATVKHDPKVVLELTVEETKFLHAYLQNHHPDKFATGMLSAEGEVPHENVEPEWSRRNRSSIWYAVNDVVAGEVPLDG